MYEQDWKPNWENNSQQTVLSKGKKRLSNLSMTPHLTQNQYLKEASATESPSVRCIILSGDWLESEHKNSSLHD
jgi:hypothetical protein